MHWITTISKAARRANHKCQYRIGRCKDWSTFTTRASAFQQQQKQQQSLNRNEGAIGKLRDSDGDAIVVSGISGRFPMTDNMEELKHHLNTKVDMITPISRWTTANPLMPKRMGAMKNMDRFDAEFFGIKALHAETMDPQQRRLLEVSFEAIFDAGVNPTDMRGTSTGVYVGTVGGETAEFWLFKGDYDESSGYRILGIPNFVQPNRVSYCLDFQGPSMGVNTGCSASLSALEAAIHSINVGTCDQAIVAGTCIHVNPFGFIELAALDALSHEGICRAFDDKADGFVRSEAVVAILVQKKRDAKRHYATIRGIKSAHDAFKREGITFPAGEKQEALLRSTYKTAGIDPKEVTYFEAHGTGTPAGDPQELLAIYNVMCKGVERPEPLLVGSVKSNMGHTESVSGLASLAKILISIEQGVIPPNINYETPNSYVKDIYDGSFTIMAESTPWKGGLVGLSSFGLGGSTVHMILEPGPKTSPENQKAQAIRTEKQIPILIPFSGRTQEGVTESLKSACKLADNSEATGLLHNIFHVNIPGNEFRGYGLVTPGQEDIDPIIQVDKYTANDRRPLWFIFPGMGSQWNEMGKDLMTLDVFAASINNSQKVLKNAGIDLHHLLRPNNTTIFNNIRDSLVSITAVQIALFDTMTHLGLRPDGFIGHSSGEILCAYADGCLSVEEALLVGDARGRAFHETITSPGGMVSVGLSWEEAHARCPPGLYPACHNAAENVTVSGPLEDIKRFAEDLKTQGIFARLVNSCNCAPHSIYVRPANDRLSRYMREIYTDDRPRSARWISSSIPEEKWGTPLAKSSSPEYHVNNMQMPVLFHDAVQKVPKNAVVVEIAPRGLFQPILRESIPSDCSLFAPMHHSVENKLHFFLSTVGKIHNAGADMNVGNLYPAITFPVSSSTPMLGSLVKWKHDQSWTTPYIENPTKLLGASFKVDITERKHSYLQGHKLDSRCVYPATGYLVLAWRAFAACSNAYHESHPIVLQDVSLERATFLKEGKPVRLKYSFLSGTDKFVIEDEGTAVIKGTVLDVPDVSTKMFNLPPVEVTPELATHRKSLNSDDVYKEFRLRGYNYSEEFRGIHTIDNQGKWALVSWTGNWVSFLDTMLQTSVLSVLTRATAVPVRFKSVIIDPNTFLDYVNHIKAVQAGTEGESSNKKEVLIPVSIYPALGTIKCPGIELRGLVAMVIPRQKQKETLSVEDYIFTPYFDPVQQSQTQLSVFSNVAGILDLVLENTTNTKLKIVDVFASAENSLAESIVNIVNLKPKHKAEVTIVGLATELEKMDEKTKALASTVLSRDSLEGLVPDSGYVDLIFLDEPKVLQSVADLLQENAHIVLRFQGEGSQVQIPAGLQRLSEKFSAGEKENTKLTLFKKLPKETTIRPEVKSTVCIDASATFDYLPALQLAMAEAASEHSPPNSRLYLYSQNDPHSGIVGLVKCLRMEPGGEKIRCIFDPRGQLPLDFQNPSKELQAIIDADLVMNVHSEGNLGSYRHIPMSQDAAFPSKNVAHAYVNTLTTGDLTSLRWVESPLTYFDPIRDAARGEVCTVHYAALNFRDIMLATGKLPVDSKTAYNPQDCVFGFEFSGVDAQNKRIMGVMGSKAMASSVLITDQCIKWEVPAKWTLEEAATIPVVYSTAYYALFNRARIQPGHSILIHSGTGGVGQAAINIALDLNCEIFTTVGTEEKRKHILELFPTLKPENIGNSRDCSFEPQVMSLTNGRGVDIVLNSLADDKLQASVRCVAIHGKFLEIGAFDSFQNSNLGMECFLRNVDLQGIFLNHFLSGSQTDKLELQKHFLNGIEKGVVKPLQRTVFDQTQIEEAFRFMAGGKHMGKVLIEVLKEDKIGAKPSLMAVPRTYFSPLKTYVIIGGLGGMGLELASWLVERGARHLVLTSRSGVQTGYQELCLRKWEEQGAKVETPVIDLSNFDLAETFVKELTANSKEIGGIFNSGLVLEDAPIEDQSVDMFQSVAAPKTVVTQNLDKLTRKYCKNLDYFVVFSSMACGRGNASQSNYGLANSVMEQICDRRKEEGLHGLAIQWGVIGEVGAVAEKIFGAKLTGEEVFDGTLAQRINSCLDVLDMTLHQKVSTVSSMVLAQDDGMRSKKAGLLETISHICGVKDLSTIDPTTKLIDLGMDSLIGMEIKQLIERDYDTPLTANEIRSMTFNDLIMIEAGTYVKGQAQSKGAGSGNDKVIDLLEMLQGGSETLVRLISAPETSGDAKKFFVLPGLEGHSLMFQHLAAKLKAQVFGFHFLPKEDDDDLQTVESMAREYIEELKLVQSEGPYNLASYSACTSIAYEMAYILENEYGDRVENLIVMDGTVCWADSENVTDASMVAKLIIGLFKSASHLTEAEEKKLTDSMVEDRHYTKVYGDMLKTRDPRFDATLVDNFFKRATNLFDIIIVYSPNHSQKLKAPTTLIKAKEKIEITAGFLDESHYLNRYCEGPVVVETVEGDHMTFLQPGNVDASVKIINDILCENAEGDDKHNQQDN